MTRAQPAIAFAVILSTCLSGIIQFSPWAAAAGASGLALILLGNGSSEASRTPGESAINTLASFLAIALNASASASAAYILGRLIAYVWGL